ncbi:MAG: hypothetical protein J6Y08_10045 [Clostridiales bacterium]|nr:hypothetical protein [Clostridiales bacterium]
MKLSKLFSDGMILQRQTINTIPVFADKDETVTVHFDEKEMPVTFKEDRFEVELPSQEAGGPHTIVVSDGTDKIEIKDVYFGDVYVLGGQSNMELPVIWTTDCHYDEIVSADFPLIRQFEVPKIPDFDKKHVLYEDGHWANCDQKNVWLFSAIGFYFAKEKFAKDGVPVGLIQTAVGGAPVEALMSEENLISSFEAIKSKGNLTGKCNNVKSKCCIFCYEDMLKRDHDKALVEKTIKEDLARQDAWHKDLADRDPGFAEHWENTWDSSISCETFNMPQTFLGTKYEDFKGSIWLQKEVDVPKDWCDQRVELRLGTLIDSDTTYVNGKKVGEFGFKYPPRRYFMEPGTLFAGKNTITIRLGIDGNIGGAVPECPYVLKLGEKEISLEGEWKMRVGTVSERLVGQTFFIWSPVGLFNSMIHPLKDVKCKAIFFYQGESNCEYPQYYAPLLKDMVKEWRDVIGEQVPFVMAEVTYWLGDGPVYDSDPFDGVRNVQREVIQEIPDGYLVKTYDLGKYNDLHPQNKKEVAMRFWEICEKL